MIDWNINLPMDGVERGNLYDFLCSAGENGWELCSAFPSGITGAKRPIEGKPELRECKEPSEQISLIFKRV
jgi:hypothetical protein